MNPMIKNITEITNKDVTTCGGKGASLGELSQQGFLVPEGFVLTTEAFGEKTETWKKEVLNAFEELNCRFVAVRSSGTKEDGVDDSFAGQFDTYLFVTKNTLIKKIKDCHKSLNKDRLEVYCKEKNITKKDIKVAVVIQKMVDSETSGVCFTQNPITGDHDEIMIEAGLGIGEAVVSGMITPDNYIINKNDNTVTKTINTQKKKLILDRKNTGLEEQTISEGQRNKQKLSDTKILELSNIAKKIEKHYNKPMDIERAVENNKIYILQARPITTIEKNNIFNNINKKNYINYGRWIQAHLSGCFWCYRNNAKVIKDIFPNIILSNLVDIDGCYLGKKENENILYKEIEKIFKNNDIDTFVKKIEHISEKYKKEYLETLHYKQTTISLENIKHFFEKNSEIVGLWWLYLLLGIVLEKYLLKYENISTEELLSYTEHSQRINWLQQQHIEIVNFANIINQKGIKEITKKELDSLGIKKEINSFVQEYERYGTHHREGDGYTLEKAIGEINEELRNKHTTSKEKETITNNYNWIKLLQSIVFWRTHCAEITAKVVYELRPYLDKIGKKIGLKGYNELLQLSHTEIIQILESNTTVNYNKYKIREKGRGCILNKDEEIVLYGSEVEYYLEYFTKGDGSDKNSIHGIIASKGKTITGKAKIILGQKDFSKFDKGDILVANETTPDFVPLMKLASGIVTNLGGITSHAAIISRELKIPCIIGTNNATYTIKDGDMIELDTITGYVKIK